MTNSQRTQTPFTLSCNRQHGCEMEVRAEILEALHSAAAEVDEVSTMEGNHAAKAEGEAGRTFC